MSAAEDLQRPKIYKSKPASELLAPYLAYLDPPALHPPRQREGRQGKGQTRSALAFRVREGSVRTLQKELAKVREREERRGRKRQQFELAKTLDSKIQREGQAEREKFIRDLEARVKKRVESRQAELDSLRRTTMEQPQLSMYRISVTNPVPLPHPPSHERQQPHRDKPRKNNFRRQKYEPVPHPPPQPLPHPPLPKQSNATANLEMDQLQAKQMKIYLKMRDLQLQRSIEKTTEEYLNADSYRPPRSKHDIDIYLSTCHPSHVVASRKEEPQREDGELIGYEFDFGREEARRQELYRLEVEMEGEEEGEGQVGQGGGGREGVLLGAAAESGGGVLPQTGQTVGVERGGLQN